MQWTCCTLTHLFGGHLPLMPLHGVRWVLLHPCVCAVGSEMRRSHLLPPPIPISSVESIFARRKSKMPPPSSRKQYRTVENRRAADLLSMMSTISKRAS